MITKSKNFIASTVFTASLVLGLFAAHSASAIVITVFDPVVYLQTTQTTIDSMTMPAGKKAGFDARVADITKLIQKNKTAKAIVAIDNFETILNKVLAKPDPKHPKPNKLSKADAQTLLDMLNTLLGHLN